MKLFKKWSSIWQSRWLFLLPSMAGVFVFAVLPFGNMLIQSFSGGLINYKTVFTNEAFHLAIKNTFRFVGVGIPLLLLLSFAAALGIYKSKWVRLFKSVYLLPMAVPTAVVVLIWKVLFHREGIGNQMLAFFHIGCLPMQRLLFWLSAISGKIWGIQLFYGLREWRQFPTALLRRPG